MKRQRFAQHANTTAHMFAEGFLQNGDSLDEGRMPTKKEWESVYTGSIGPGALDKSGVSDVASRKKFARCSGAWQRRREKQHDVHFKML